MRTLQMEPPLSKRQRVPNRNAPLNPPLKIKITNDYIAKYKADDIEYSVYPLPFDIKLVNTYLEDHRADHLIFEYRATTFYIKLISIFSYKSAILLKSLQSTPDFKNFLVPLLLQFVHDRDIVQVFPVVGKDLIETVNSMDKETYMGQRDTIIKTMNESISFLHRKNILHRDIQPFNVIWDGTKCLLIDFDTLLELPLSGDKSPNGFRGSIALKNKNDSIFNKDRDLYAAEVTIQILDILKLGEDEARVKHGTLEDQSISWVKRYTEQLIAKGGARMRSRSTRKHRSYKKNGRLRAGQSRRRNYTRHVARQL